MRLGKLNRILPLWIELNNEKEETFQEKRRKNYLLILI